jgi:hypothetical protein
VESSWIFGFGSFVSLFLSIRGDLEMTGVGRIFFALGMLFGRGRNTAHSVLRLKSGHWRRGRNEK